MKKLMIIGASGHGKVLADIAEKTGEYSAIAFLDDAVTGTCARYEILGKCEDYVKFIDDYCFIVAIGNAKIRQRIQLQMEKTNARVITLIHPSAVISRGVSVGCGTAIVAGAVINADAKIGKGVIINTCASVDHDCEIGDFSHISVGARLAGNVKVGTNSIISAGATVINNIEICENVVIGAGAVVVKSIEKSGTYIGVPAKIKI
jgi:sugar O-acyltransferase (sialic acid O-acetyltransferase NeuD family)